MDDLSEALDKAFKTLAIERPSLIDFAEQYCKKCNIELSEWHRNVLAEVESENHSFISYQGSALGKSTVNQLVQEYRREYGL